MDERILKYFQDSLTQSERLQLLEDVYIDVELKRQMMDYQLLHTLMNLHPDTIDRKKGRERYSQFMHTVKQQQIKRFFISSLRYAAVAAIFIASTYWVTSQSMQPEVVQIATQELYVPAGQRAQLTLPDGSKVWLNADSRLTYPSLFGKERKVTLTGEGYFEVAKHAEAPFIVSTGSVDVKALGTQFNVFSYPESEEMSVYLAEGSVSVYQPAAELKGVILKPNQRYMLKGSKASVENVTDPLLWREGIYTFNKQSFGDIIARLELYFDVEIITVDKAILTYECTGKFRQRDGVMEILRVLQHMHHFQVKKDEDKNQIILSR